MLRRISFLLAAIPLWWQALAAPTLRREVASAASPSVGSRAPRLGIEASPPAQAQNSRNTASPARTETQIWNLEKSYWDYVKANDLEKYRALWHEQFLGWPFTSSSPARKDKITDWITKNTSQGIKLQSYDLEQVAIQVTGDIVADHYRIKMSWSGPKPTDTKTETLRIHHTWIRTGDTWQIIAGMSAPVNSDGK